MIEARRVELHTEGCHRSEDPDEECGCGGIHAEVVALRAEALTFEDEADRLGTENAKLHAEVQRLKTVRKAVIERCKDAAASAGCPDWRTCDSSMCEGKRAAAAIEEMLDVP